MDENEKSTLKGEIETSYRQKPATNLKVEKALKVRQTTEQFLATNPKGLRECKKCQNIVKAVLIHQNGDCYGCHFENEIYDDIIVDESLTGIQKALFETEPALTWLELAFLFTNLKVESEEIMENN